MFSREPSTFLTLFQKKNSNFNFDDFHFDKFQFSLYILSFPSSSLVYLKGRGGMGVPGSKIICLHISLCDSPMSLVLKMGSTTSQLQTVGFWRPPT